MTDLYLPVKRIYFDQIKAGTKPKEYRLVTPYWIKRLVNREYDYVIITLGYPRQDEHSKRMVFDWNGYEQVKITHPHFGPDEVDVFAIDLSHRVPT